MALTLFGSFQEGFDAIHKEDEAIVNLDRKSGRSRENKRQRLTYLTAFTDRSCPSPSEAAIFLRAG